MNSLVEVSEDTKPSPCKYGNIVPGHACYCNHPEAYRKCPQWRNDEPYEECEYYEERE
jgi:hypothetical protein